MTETICYMSPVICSNWTFKSSSFYSWPFLIHFKLKNGTADKEPFINDITINKLSTMCRKTNMFRMMKIETVLETSVSFIHLTRLIAREDFIDLPC
jgi:hypothetical protein